MEENLTHIPEGWFEDTILELCHIGRGRVISQKEITENIGEYPVYSSQTQNNGEMGRIDSFDFEGNYITWTTDGANAGTVFYRTGKFNCTNVCGTLQEKDKSIDLKFLAYKLSTVAKKHVSYIGNPKLMNGTMSKVSLVIPKSKLEQTQIAAILSKVDEAITQTEKLIAKYNRIKTGLMQDLLTKGIDENGNIRSEETHEFKDSPLGRIPKEWEVDILNSFISYISYGFTNPMPESQEGPFLITAANVNQGRILYETSRKTTEKAFKELLTKKSRPQLNDVLITKDGSIGRLAVVDSEYLCINQSVAVMRVRAEKINYNFFKILLESNRYQDLIMADSGGSTIKHIYITKIDKMNLAVPSNIKEQEMILKVLESKENILNETKFQLSKLQSLKTGLMQDLLSGKVRVNHLIKETASV